MPVPSETPWPTRSPLILTAIALALSILSQRSTGWLGTALGVGAVVMAFLAAVAFLQTWLRRGRPRL
jgi:uncharacterized protein (DUF58 family)